MDRTAWFSLARPLVLAHALVSILLVGAATHHLVATLRYFNRREDPRMCRSYGAIVGISYLATLVLGAFAYPTYRYYVRALFLDRDVPWASNLFDLKVDLASIGLPAALATWWLGASLGGDDDRDIRLGYTVMAVLVTAIVWVNVISGLLVTIVRGVG